MTSKSAALGVRNVEQPRPLGSVLKISEFQKYFLVSSIQINCGMRQNKENSSNHEGEPVVNLTPSYQVILL